MKSPTPSAGRWLRPGPAACSWHLAGIVLAPAVGAILMTVSTIVVAANAQLLRRVDLRPLAYA